MARGQPLSQPSAATLPEPASAVLQGLFTLVGELEGDHQYGSDVVPW